MLKSLTVRNYALIERLDIKFKAGFSTITGETGAGKSILLGALGLLVGARASVSVLKNKEKKCIVEAEFDVSNFHFEPLLDEYGIDYEEITIIRREITPQGKSRAFVNDTPVQVGILKKIGDRLIDIHSQHQNLILHDKDFQISVVDAFTENATLLEGYRTDLRAYKKTQTAIQELNSRANQSQAEQDYNQFLYEELEKAKLLVDEQQSLEDEQHTLSNSEHIMSLLASANQGLNGGEENALTQLASIKKLLQDLQAVHPQSKELFNRFQSAYIEFQDLANEVERTAEGFELDPERLQFVNERLSLLFQLQKKHNVNSNAELLEIQASLESKLVDISSFEDQLAKLKAQEAQLHEQLHKQAKALSKNRLAAKPDLETAIQNQLESLGMPNGVFSIVITPTEQFNPFGKEQIDFAFSANKHIAPESLAKIASGGEISRLMLSLKSILSTKMKLPSIIFDEIDTGVSGEISARMGMIMKKMSGNMQVMSITHQAQIAAMGVEQFKVMKIEGEDSTQSTIQRLSAEERTAEIAKMLSGTEVTQASVENAKVLLANS